MSSGITHDRVSLTLWPVAIVAASAASTQFPIDPFVYSVGYLAGFLYLSPDIDIGGKRPSRPTQRWGIFRFIWWRYQKTHRHRGISHLPLWGSAERLFYLLRVPLAIAIGGYSGFMAVSASSLLRGNLLAIASTTSPILFSFWVGVETACLLHLFCDYCPILRKM